MTDVIAAPAEKLHRWNSQGDEWHTHAVRHAHPDADEGHQHIMATDEDTLERLKRLLKHAARGPLTEDYRREAAELLELAT